MILVFSFGFIRGSAWGMGYGLIAGLLMDLSSGGPLGFHTLIFIWMGYVIFPAPGSRIHKDRNYKTLRSALILYRLFLYISRRLEEMEKRRDTTIV